MCQQRLNRVRFAGPSGALLPARCRGVSDAGARGWGYGWVRSAWRGTASGELLNYPKESGGQSRVKKTSTVVNAASIRAS